MPPMRPTSFRDLSRAIAAWYQRVEQGHAGADDVPSSTGVSAKTWHAIFDRLHDQQAAPGGSAAARLLEDDAPAWEAWLSHPATGLSKDVATPELLCRGIMVLAEFALAPHALAGRTAMLRQWLSWASDRRALVVPPTDSGEAPPAALRLRDCPAAAQQDVATRLSETLWRRRHQQFRCQEVLGVWVTHAPTQLLNLDTQWLALVDDLWSQDGSVARTEALGAPWATWLQSTDRRSVVRHALKARPDWPVEAQERLLAIEGDLWAEDLAPQLDRAWDLIPRTLSDRRLAYVPGRRLRVATALLGYATPPWPSDEDVRGQWLDQILADGFDRERLFMPNPARAPALALLTPVWHTQIQHLLQLPDAPLRLSATTWRRLLAHPNADVRLSAVGALSRERPAPPTRGSSTREGPSV